MRKSQQSPQGGRIRKEIPIHVSNVMLVDEAADTRTRVGSAVKDGKKVRVARKTGNLSQSGSTSCRHRHGHNGGSKLVSIRHQSPERCD